MAQRMPLFTVLRILSYLPSTSSQRSSREGLSSVLIPRVLGKSKGLFERPAIKDAVRRRKRVPPWRAIIRACRNCKRLTRRQAGKASAGSDRLSWIESH